MQMAKTSCIDGTEKSIIVFTKTPKINLTKQVKSTYFSHNFCQSQFNKLVLLTMDETWLYHYEPETKQQLMEWRHSGSPRPKKFRVQKSAGNFLVSIFWDKDSILLIDCLPKGKTINAECYSSLLVQLKDILKEKRREKFTKWVLFLHNAPPHRALAAQKKLACVGFQCLDHQPILRIWPRRTSTRSLD